jgi:hypothetical protein
MQEVRKMAERIKKNSASKELPHGARAEIGAMMYKQEGSMQTRAFYNDLVTFALKYTGGGEREVALLNL